MTKATLFGRICTLMMALGVFFIGTQEMCADTYKWTGASSTAWELADNWDNETNPTSPGVPGIGDEAWFTGSPTNAPTISTTTANVGTLNIDIDVTITLNGYNLVVGYLDILDFKTLTMSVVNGLLRVNTAATLGEESVLGGTCQLELYGTLAMHLDQVAGIGPDIYTWLYKADFLASDCVFYGDIALNATTTPISIQLTDYDLYLGEDADIIGHTTSLKATSGFVETRHADCNISTYNGRLCKHWAGLTNPTPMSYPPVGAFKFPVGDATHEYTPITMVLDCFDPSLISSSTVPFAYVSVRTVTNWGNPKGHPDHGQQNFGVYWVVKGEGLPEATNGAPLFGFSGLMEFSNTYRAAQPDSIFSAMYKAPIGTSGYGNWEDVCLNTGYWDLKGSIQVLESTGDDRSCPFGRWLSQSAECMLGYGDISAGTNTGGTIPVELTSFSARYYDGTVRLDWQTATELNNHGFYVERSLDGENWEDISFVEGAGTSNVPLKYMYTDRLMDMLRHAPTIAYRLRQEDRDGTVDYSGIVYAQTGAQPEGVELYKAYPNPFNPSTTLSFSLQEAAHVTMKVYNTFGQEVAMVANTNFDAGFHTLEFEGAELPSGVYIAVLDAAGSVHQQKLVLNK